MSKTSRLGGPFDRQQGKRAGKLIQSQLQIFTIFIDHCEGN